MDLGTISFIFVITWYGINIAYFLYSFTSICLLPFRFAKKIKSFFSKASTQTPLFFNENHGLVPNRNLIYQEPKDIPLYNTLILEEQQRQEEEEREEIYLSSISYQ